MTPSMPRFSKREPLVAILLSLIVPGLGHLYLGRLVESLGLLVGHVALGSLGTLVAVAGASSISTVLLAALPWCVLWLASAIWSGVAAKRTPPLPFPSEYQRPGLYAFVGLLALPHALAWTMAVREHVAELFRVPSSSMLPGIPPGSRVLVNKLAYRNHPIERGDRVVFTNPNARHERYIKRVVALPGDLVEMKDDELWINGRKLEYADVADRGEGTHRIENPGRRAYDVVLLPRKDATLSPSVLPPIQVPNGNCFVLGDNRHRSQDSRDHGPVPLTDVLGRVERVF